MQRIDASNVDLHRGGFIGGFYIRPMGPWKKGDVAKGHAHFIDHVTNLVRGKVRIDYTRPDGSTDGVEVLVPCKLLIKAEVHHTFTVLEDDTYWECWFAEAQAEKQLGMLDVPWHMGPDHG